MPGLASSRAETSVPLSPEEVRRGERVAARLHTDLGRIVAQFPPHAAGGSAMARYLDIVRNTCQRVITALSDAEPSIHTLAKLPGVKGLEQFLEAARGRGVDGPAIEVAESAVRDFEAFVEESGRSHSGLIARIEAPSATTIDDPADSEEARAELVAGAARVTGRLVDATVSTYIFAPDREDPGRLHQVLATALIGNTVTPGAMPVVLTSGQTSEWDDTVERSTTFLDESPVRGSTPQAILEPFTTHPLPTVTTRGEPGNLIHVIDPRGLDGRATFDVVTCLRSVHPIRDPETGKPTLDEVWTLVNAPTRRLVQDVFLHADMERDYRPSMDALMWYPNLSVPGGDKWVARFPAQPRLELLGPGLDRIATSAYARRAELARYLFDRVGWSPDEFVGYRCEVAYPIWRAGYCMTFSYIGPDASGSPQRT
jgi:hypothetical protein